MSGSMEKATRRDIRRAFGAQAAQEVETIATDVRNDVEKIGHQLRQYNTLIVRWMDKNDAEIKDLAAAWAGRLSFRERLRWLVFGRIK